MMSFNGQRYLQLQEDSRTSGNNRIQFPIMRLSELAADIPTELRRVKTGPECLQLRKRADASGSGYLLGTLIGPGAKRRNAMNSPCGS